MEFPHHWVKARGAVEGSDGRYLEAWGWSSSSRADAAAVAQRRLADLLAQARAGRFPQPREWYYPRTPPRERVLHALRAPDGALLALVTRNRYGATVLNTERLAIADVDLPDLVDAPEEPRKKGWFRRDTRRTQGDITQEALGSLRQFAARHPHLGLRIYRTAAGLRVMVTGAQVRPGDESSRALLLELGSDPLYVELSQAHQSYRARLSPKPWRCGMPPMSGVVPHGDRDDLPGEAPEEMAWIGHYQQRAAEFVTCQLIESLGPAPGPDESDILTLHDEMTGVDRSGPLA